MRVLITGDDGPPSSVSPYVLGLYQELRKFGWEISVVIPSSQKSWGGMHFAAHHPCSVWYYYPRADNLDGSHPDTRSSWSATRRPIDESVGECGEWVVMDASPASCANAGIFNQKLLFPDSPDKPIDLVVSGPNYGRNTGSSFALGSGTVGAALAASLAQTKAISLSYGHFAILPKKLREAESRLAPSNQAEPSSCSLDADKDKQKPTSSPVAAPQVVAAAHKLSASLIKRLWDQWEAEVGVYTINLPLAWTILEPKVCWTTMWLGKHGRLYDVHDPSKPSPWVPAGTKSDLSEEDGPQHVPDFAPQPHMKLRFAPDMQAMLAPRDLPEGTDIWALMNGWVSVTRLRPAYAEVLTQQELKDREPGGVWRL